jgi:MFS family permease
MTRARGPLLLPALVFLGVVSTVVGSLGAPLLPTIAREDHVSLATSQWALTISLLAGAIAAPVLGRLGDGRHRRTVIVSALAVVAVGCALSALPVGFEWMLVGRALQGVGLGLVPLAMAAARDGLPAEKLAPGIALLGVTTAAGLGIGYPVVGVIAQYLGLSAAFWCGLAITLVALVASAVVLPAGPDRPAKRLDVPAIALLGVAVTGVLLACAEGPQWGWTSSTLLITVVVAVVFGAAWVWWELRVPSPLVNVRLLAHPSVLAADLMVVLVGVGIYPLLSLVVRYVQTAPEDAGYGYGYATAIAGLMLVPYSLASFLASRLTQRLMGRLTAEVVVALSSVVLIVSMVVFLTERQNLVWLTVSMFLAGFGIGVIFAVQPAQIQRGVPAHETGSANSFYQVLRYVGYSLGSALSATLLVVNTPASSATPDESGYSAAAWFGIGALILAVLAATALSRRGAVRSRPGSSPVSRREQQADSAPTRNAAAARSEHPGHRRVPGPAATD